MSYACYFTKGVNGFLLYKKLTVKSYKQYKNFVSSVACFYH